MKIYMLWGSGRGGGGQIIFFFKDSPLFKLQGSKQEVIEVVLLNPFALSKAKIVYNFGLSECNRVKHTIKGLEKNHLLEKI